MPAASDRELSLCLCKDSDSVGDILHGGWNEDTLRREDTGLGP